MCFEIFIYILHADQLNPIYVAPGERGYQLWNTQYCLSFLNQYTRITNNDVHVYPLMQDPLITVDCFNLRSFMTKRLQIWKTNFY